MKFIADAMLGRLAKWLRLMGFDVLYYHDISDRELIRIAREQERTILTRDTRLVKSSAIKDPIYIQSDAVFAQLMQMRDRLDFRNASLLGRCEICNGTLSCVPEKKEIRDLVPDFVYHNFESFVRCEECGKVYWEGSHFRKIREKIGEVMRDGMKEEIED
jgi:uncharacterized protein with PIN domain